MRSDKVREWSHSLLHPSNLGTSRDSHVGGTGRAVLTVSTREGGKLLSCRDTGVPRTDGGEWTLTAPRQESVETERTWRREQLKEVRAPTLGVEVNVHGSFYYWSNEIGWVNIEITKTWRLSKESEIEINTKRVKILDCNRTHRKSR